MRPAYATDRRLVVSNPVRGPSQRAAEGLSSSRPTLWVPPYRGLESSGRGAKRADAHGGRYISDLGYEIQWTPDLVDFKGPCIIVHYIESPLLPAYK